MINLAGLPARTVTRFVDPLYPEPSPTRLRISERELPWLGAWSRPTPRPSLAKLVAQGVISPGDAHDLANLAGQRVGVLVIAGTSGAGKTTLLEALLPCFPGADRRVRLRGSYETFAWARDDDFDPAQSVLIAEEISGHLPGYLWGPAVGEYLDWRPRGAALLATAHAEEPVDVVRLLSGYPLRLPATAVAAFDLIVRLGRRSESNSRHVVDAIWATSASDGDGVAFEQISAGSGIDRRRLATVLGPDIAIRIGRD